MTVALFMRYDSHAVITRSTPPLNGYVQEVLARAYRRADVIVVLDDETDEDRILLDDDIDSGPIDAEHIDSVSRLVAFVVSKHNASLEEQG